MQGFAKGRRDFFKNAMNYWKTRARAFTGFGVAGVCLTTVLGVLTYDLWRIIHREDGAHRQVLATLHWTSVGFVICVVFGAALSSVAFGVGNRLRAEGRLHEREEQFREAFDRAPFGMCLSALNGQLIQANVAFCRMLGYSELELLNSTWSELTHPDDKSTSPRMLKQLRENPDGCAESEKRYIHRSGAVVWAHVRVSVVRGRRGAPRCHVVYVEDITESRRAGDKLFEEAAEGANHAKPIVAVTANAMPDDREGMNDHLSRPVDLRPLQNALARWPSADDTAAPDLAGEKPTKGVAAQEDKVLDA